MGNKRKKQRAKARKRAASKAPAAGPPEAALAPQGEAAQTAASFEATEAAEATAVEHRASGVVPANEHRASERISIEVELHIASESHFFSDLSGDISEGGVFVSTYRPLALGSLVDLEFSLPGSDEALHARGEVRWHRDLSPHGPPGVGIAFEELPDEDRERIHRFCTMRPPLYYDVG